MCCSLLHSVNVLSIYIDVGGQLLILPILIFVKGNLGAFLLFQPQSAIPKIVQFSAHNQSSLPPYHMRFGLLQNDVIHRYYIRMMRLT